MNRVRSSDSAESHADTLRFSLRDVLMFAGGVGVILATILGAWLRFENRVTTIEVGHGQRLETIENNQGRQAEKIDRIAEVLGAAPRERDDRHAEFRQIPKRQIHE